MDVILGVGVLFFLSGVAIFAVGIHLFVMVASLFAKPMPATNGNLRVIERDYDYDTDY